MEKSRIDWMKMRREHVQAALLTRTRVQSGFRNNFFSPRLPVRSGRLSGGNAGDVVPLLLTAVFLSIEASGGTGALRSHPCNMECRIDVSVILIAVLVGLHLLAWRSCAEKF